jgi:DUF4097 and DUF4098 domain-containing protein YvlB
MPTYDTPEPISVTLELGVADVRITATDRTDTVVEVRPSDESDESDVAAARQVRAEHANGVLQLTGPKARVFDFSRKTRSVDVTIELPAGSDVTTQLQAGNVRCTGSLGRCRLRTAAGNVQVERVGSLQLNTAAGHVTAEVVAGDAEISTGSGEVRLGAVEGAATVKNTNGDTTIDTVGGEVRVRAANGSIRVGRPGAGVDAKTANGGIRLDEVVRGAVVLETAMGDVEVGIAEGTAAWLEVNTGFGKVRNLLAETDRPAATDEKAEVRANTTFGDITIRRS